MKKILFLLACFGIANKFQTDLHNYNLSLTGLPAGHYFVHVIKNGKTYRRQLIVQ
ncbi:MAG: T9SS type A sorting domain-containing protein [Bacteroidales bacterium]|nr:T9SS type A sorting domain-containing protein [Bacteroidales bacterium]MCK9311636.1 T9SS type A sorting domain-containing protein [Bacteroidales bacterium]